MKTLLNQIQLDLIDKLMPLVYTVMSTTILIIVTLLTLYNTAILIINNVSIPEKITTITIIVLVTLMWSYFIKHCIKK